MKKHYIAYILIGVGIFSIYHFMLSVSKESALKSIAARKAKIYQIALVSAVYANDNNLKFPERWSILIPEYFSEDDGYLFLRNLKRPVESQSISHSAIDENSIYNLIEWQSNIWIVFEKPEIWEDGKIVWCWVLLVDGKWTKGRIGIGDSRTFEKLIVGLNREHG